MSYLLLVCVFFFFIDKVAIKAEPGVSSSATSKQEQNDAEEFGPKLPPSFSSGRFCRLVVCKFYMLKKNTTHTSLINVCESVPYPLSAMSNVSTTLCYHTVRD